MFESTFPVPDSYILMVASHTKDGNHSKQGKKKKWGWCKEQKNISQSDNRYSLRDKRKYCDHTTKTGHYFNIGTLKERERLLGN